MNVKAFVICPPLGLETLRISLDRLTVEVPAISRALPGPLAHCINSCK